MCYRHDYDLSFSGSIKDAERKPLKNELACAVIRNREGIGSVFDFDMAFWTVCANAKALSGLRS
jgi:hypothetical protein